MIAANMQTLMEGLLPLPKPAVFEALPALTAAAVKEREALREMVEKIVEHLRLATEDIERGLIAPCAIQIAHGKHKARALLATLTPRDGEAT